MKYCKYASFVGFLLLLLGCGSQEQQSQKAALPVNTQTITSQDTELSFEYPARLKSVQSVDIYARIEGILLTQNFTEGDIVQAGQTLFTIESTRYKARVSMAKAQYDTALANLTKASKDWKRTERLYKQGALTVDQYDNAMYNYQSAQANVDNAKASLDDALVDLKYTNITADITGRIGMRRYDVGNLVGRNGGGGDTYLTTLTQLTPIYAEFSIPSTDFYYMRDLDKDNVVVEFILGNNKLYDKRGKLDFLDSVLDSQTASIKARAIVNNDAYILLPNEIVRVNLKGFKAQKAIAIPQNALLQDSQGSYVYIVKNNQAQITRLMLGKMLKNGQVIVLSGLQDGDILITNNLTKLRQGSEVSPQTAPQNTPQNAH
ncbi:efflux RND transporter periplasmic adaptor subunit [uncultured Helicobacter sp.]|uniref:efflux RND transporter periplasmic adaptor subunit n=1 Tax=uncultured Helicobacter sp. TaxID=175537 RepID=UPI001C3BA513|nr:efflux RND transporter periplasmic adaptor subunit [Candidatus Helicobacter avicola]